VVLFVDGQLQVARNCLVYILLILPTTERNPVM